jgi:hypothetical protein
MVFFIAALSPKVVNRDLSGTMECPACGGAGAMQERRVDHMLSLFFVPLITVHRGQPFTACGRCGWSSLKEGRAAAGAGGSDRQGGRAVSGRGAWPARVCAVCGGQVGDAGWTFCPFCGSML